MSVPLRTDFLGALTISGFCLKYHLGENARTDLLKTGVSLQMVGMTIGFFVGIGFLMAVQWLWH